MFIKIRIKIFITTLFLFFALFYPGIFRAEAQGDSSAMEFCRHARIRTILFHRAGWELSMPVIALDEAETLELRYDYMGEPEIDFSYSVANCSYDWKINEISEHKYLEGFNDVPIFDFKPSRNTTTYFTHYLAKIPNDDLNITQSGNYLVRVYASNEPDSILFTRRFAIVDRKVEIKANINRPDKEHQEIMLQVDLKNLRLMDPLQEIKLVILKNYDWNNPVVYTAKPMLRNGVLHYDMPFQIMAKGGNEFRSLDTKNTYFMSNGVAGIEYISPYFYYFLKPEKLRQFDPYFSDADLNGRSYYEVPDAQDRHLDADYVQVNFKLESDQPLGSEVYVYGALTNWQTDESNFMVYKPDEGIYEATLLIKQGMLNYAYALRDYDKQQIDFDITEGNHAETENDYLIFVYYKGIMSDRDELVGYEVVNSVGKER